MRRLFHHRGRWVTFAGLGALLALVGAAVLVQDPMAAPGAKVLGETLVDSASTFTVSVTSPDPTLYPGGDSAPVDLEFTNLLSQPITITSITVTFTNSFVNKKGKTCDATALVFGGSQYVSGTTFNATISDTTNGLLGVSATPGSNTNTYDTTLALANQGDQDSCQMLPLSMTYSAKARYTDGSGTVLTSSHNPVAVGGSTTLTATVTPSSPIADSHNTVDDGGPGTPSGTATFYQCPPTTPTQQPCVSLSNGSVVTTTGTLTLGTNTLSSGGTATWSPPAYTMAGSFYYQASYAPGYPNDFQPSVSGLLTEVVQGATCITSPAPAGYTRVVLPSPYNGNYEVKGGSYLFLDGGTINGNVTVDSGAALDAIGGLIKGNVQGNGGQIALQGTNVTGNVQGSASAIGLGPNTVIGGNLQPSGGTVFCSAGASTGPVSVDNNLQVQNLGSTKTPVTICNTSIKGNLQYQSNAAPVVIGGPSCSGNTVGGNLQVQSNSALVTVSGNTVGGNLQVQNNTGGGTLTNNTTKPSGGNCQLQGDTTPISGSGNTVPTGKTDTCDRAA